MEFEASVKSTSQENKFLHPSSLPPSVLRVDPLVLTNEDSTEIVDPKLYSGFLEHLGRCIYGGIVDDHRDPSPAELLVKQDGEGIKKGRAGFRKDVMQVLGKDGDLQVPMLRWPGGNFVSNYHWQDGIGPIDQRPKRLELAWLGHETNQFGTDEFIDYCRATGITPFICLNMGTGTFEEALSWLEYCNGTGDTYWANLRRKNTGRNDPHDVKYWGLGNEMYGPWQVGHLNASDYGKKAAQWSHGLKIVDPSIQLISCGLDGISDWDREVLQAVVPHVDYHSVHFYSMLSHHLAPPNGTSDYEKNVFGPAAAERAIDVCSSLIDLAKKMPRTHTYGEQIPDFCDRDIKICFDEWNVWDVVKAPGSKGLEQTYDFTDALAVAAWLNIFVRKHKEVGIACIAQSVNVISPLITKKDGILFQTTYYPLRLFSRYMKNGKVLDLNYKKTEYTGPTHPSWIQHMSTPLYVDCVAMGIETGSETGKYSIRLSVLNRHPTADWDGKLEFLGFDITSIEAHEMYSDDLSAVNTWDKPDTVRPRVTKFSESEWKDMNRSDWTFKKHSWTFFVIEGRFA